MKIPESELIINSDGSIFHLHIRPEQLAEKVILVGDPGRVALLKSLAETVRCEGASREFVWFTGTYHGVEFTALSTGIGTDNIDIVMTELDALANIDFTTREVKKEHTTLTILRVGTCGAIQPDINVGDFVLSHYSIGFDGLLNWYAGRDKVTDQQMEDAFVKHMGWLPTLPAPYIVKNSEKLIKLLEPYTVKGMTISAPGFYGPQGRVVRNRLAMPDMLEKIESFKYGDRRITNFEMEGSALAGLATHLGHEAATLCCVVAQRYNQRAFTDYKTKIIQLLSLVLDTLSSSQNH